MLPNQIVQTLETLIAEINQLKVRVKQLEESNSRKTVKKT